MRGIAPRKKPARKKIAVAFWTKYPFLMSDLWRSG